MLAALALIAVSQPNYANAAAATLKQIKAGDWTHLAASIDPNGVWIGQLDAANLKHLSPAQFKSLLASKKKVQWIPPMEVEGGDTAPAYTASLKEALQGFRVRDWSKGKASFGKSIEPGAYRTLYISDLAKKLPKGKFVEYFFGNPHGQGEEIFDAVLILGYTQRGTGYRLSALAQDSFKD